MSNHAGCSMCGGYGYTCFLGFCPLCLGCLCCGGSGIDSDCLDPPGRCPHCPAGGRPRVLARFERWEQEHQGTRPRARIQQDKWRDEKRLRELIGETF